jgi:hypothetical protein
MRLRTRLREETETISVSILVLVVSLACSDKPKTTDSTLARDLALANQATTPLPQFNDTALTSTPTKAPATKRPAPPVTRPRVEVPAPSTTVAESAPPPAAAPAPPPFRGIASGTGFDLKTKSPVCTTNLPGDKITATITSDVVGENGATIPAGTVVVLEVSEVVPGDKPETARVTLRIRSVLVNDQPVAVPSDVVVTSELERRTLPRDKGSDRRKVVGGAVAGAIVGQIMGKDTKSTVTGAVVGAAAGAATAAATGTKYDACVPSGASLRATTTQPVVIPSEAAVIPSEAAVIPSEARDLFKHSRRF